MKKVLPLLIIALCIALVGCPAQRKPAPQDQTERVIPSESNIGFSRVDTDQAPATVKRMLSALEGRQVTGWANVGNDNYIIINPGEDDDNVKISEVVQRVPNQNFLWLDVRMVKDERNENQKPKLMVYRLDDTDKAIDGVGFEMVEEEQPEPEPAKNEQAPGQAKKEAPQTRPAPERQPQPERQTQPEQTQPETQPEQQPENGDREQNGGNGQNQS